jgi:hypothetical protein
MRNYHQICLSIVVAAVLTAMGAAQSTADTIYTYTGNPFTSATSPYTTNDFVSGSFDLATPLGNNFPLSSITPLSFSFSDGVQTITSTTPGVQPAFEVQTGASGIPEFWEILLTILPPGSTIHTCSLPGPRGSGNPLCFETIRTAIDEVFISSTVNFVGNILSPGTWSVTTTPVPGPTIGSGLTGFILAGGGLLVWWRARRKTGKSHSVALAAA